MKNINNIIQSELVTRTNNIKFKQEFGELGVDTNVRNEGDSTIFTTSFGIDKILFLTVNGINLIEGVHYFVEDEFNIHISNQGDPLNPFSKQSINILVVYTDNRNRYTTNIIKIPPVINTFYLNKYSGVAEKVIFNFDIEARDGKNIYWSILKNGSEDPLFSGSSLVTTNGVVVDSSGNLVDLSYYITESEYLNGIGTELTFTLVVIYDLNEDGSVLDEKILKDAKFELLDIPPVTGSIITSPEYISTAGQQTINIDYSIINPTINTYSWQVVRTFNSGTESIVASGNTAADITDTIVENIMAVEGVLNEYRFYLKVKSAVDTDFAVISNDKTTVNVPVASMTAKIGYLDEAVMNYQDNGTWVKIGWSGTSDDITQYNNRVPDEIFTYDMPVTDLGTGEYLGGTVWNPNGTISKVYYVIEAPESWGQLEFALATGVVGINAFNKIILGNGYVAYLYADAPSPVSTPPKYKVDRA